MQPPLFPDLQQYFEAFWILSPRRTKLVGMGGASEDYISLTELHAYFDIMQITDVEERLDYLKFITVMDHAYLKWKSEHAPKQDGDKPKSKNPKFKRK